MKKSSVKLSGGYRAALCAIIVAFLTVIILNVVLVGRAEREHIQSEGQMRLSSIASRADSDLYRSECLLDSVAMQIEQLIAMDTDADERLSKYFCAETVEDIVKRSDGNCFNAYAAYNGDIYIYNANFDENFVLEERSWYMGAKMRMGEVNITEPYMDATGTGKMCYTLSKLLSDGKTIVGLDFEMSGIQQYIEEMNDKGSGISFIVDDSGIIIGHSNPEYIGRDSRELTFYNELVNKINMLYGEPFEYRSEGIKYNIFSYKTNYGWYLAVCMKPEDINAKFGSDIWHIAAVMVIVAVAVSLLFIQTCREKLKAEKTLADREAYLRNMSLELKRPVSRIINRADIMGSYGENGNEAGDEISDSAKELDRMLDELLSDSCKDNDAPKENVVKKKKTFNHVLRIVLVTAVLIATGAFAIITNKNTQYELSRNKMEKEAELYLTQVKEWALKNETVLEVISESIAAQPGFEEDYDSAVAYLNSIISQYDDISVAYVCNTEWENSTIMNNGWLPDEGFRFDERQWYRDAVLSYEELCITAPYLDEQTGLYCITLSRAVCDEKGDFVGVLGIDFYLDKLIDILGESYTDTGYAFLTDIDGNILNHPNEEYQMKPDHSVNISDLCYKEALPDMGSDYTVITDYDGASKVCFVMNEEISGFNVFVVKDLFYVKGSAVGSFFIYIVVFSACIIIVNVIMYGIYIWQTMVNKELKEAADKAISAGKAKNDFLANMSHEIRTPINAVLGMNEMIMRESSEENIVEYAANIQSSGRTLLSIINDILDFSKIESGKMEIVPVSYDVSSLIYDIVNMVRMRAEKKKLQFISEIDESIPSTLYGDDVRIRQVITNILTNAVKYTHEGYVRLRIRVANVEGDMIRLEVSVTDTGIGIKEEDMDKLFDSFRRLDQEKNRSIEGTGLGMSIVQRLLDMMGSELKVSSVYGSGSTFSFEIEQKIVKAEPIGDFEQRFKAAAAEHVSDGVIRIAPDARVLVVDDNDTNLLVARSLLKRTKIKLDLASSGAKCIELLKQNSYHVVFLDHMMPEMDGIQTLQRIKEENLAPETIFVALTANAIHGARQGYLDAGFDDYLSKPFTGRDIEKCLFGHLPSELCKEEIQAPEEKSAEEKNISEKTEENSLFSPDVGAKYTGGDMEAYREILSVYVRKADELSERIERLFNEKDWKNYVIEVHALKSSSLTVGSKQLSELAKELELSGKAGNYAVIEEKNAELLELYKKVAGFGREYLGETDAPKEEEPSEDVQLEEISSEKAREILNAIKEACLAYDADEAERLCGEIAGCSVNGQPLKPVLDEIMAAANDFEYEAAAEAAEKLAEKL